MMWYARPSESVPYATMSMMFGWPIWLTARASWMNRSTAIGDRDTPGFKILIAARLPITGWVALYTTPMPPRPSSPSMT